MPVRNEIELVLFDLGGVLLQLKDPIKTFGLDIDESEFNRNWLLSPAVREHESGLITAEKFAGNITREMKLSYDADEFLKRFVAWPGSPYPDAIDLVQRIDERYACAILSNTNALHWHSLDIENSFGKRFERYFLSFETGLLKPDARAFSHVIETYGCMPNQILFVDDNPLNVDAAIQTGMQAALCRARSDLSSALIGGKLLV